MESRGLRRRHRHSLDIESLNQPLSGIPSGSGLVGAPLPVVRLRRPLANCSNPSGVNRVWHETKIYLVNYATASGVNQTVLRPKIDHPNGATSTVNQIQHGDHDVVIAISRWLSEAIPPE